MAMAVPPQAPDSTILAGLALASDGTLYIADSLNNRIRKVSPDGIITTVAGNGSTYPDQDGLPASESAVKTPVSVALNANGTLYFVESGRIRYIRPDGKLATVAGVPPLFSGDFQGDGGLAATAMFNQPQGMCFAPDGSIYIADLYNNRVRHIHSNFPNAGGAAFVIASPDGSQIYSFNDAGRHEKTLNAFTGAVLWKFNYDSEGRLRAATDVDGNVISIERDNQGNPIANRVALRTKNPVINRCQRMA